MSKMTADDAFEIASSIRKCSAAIGDYLEEKWSELTPAQRRKLEDAEWDLLNYSTTLRTSAVGMLIDETKVSLAKLKTVTARAEKAVKKLKGIQKVLGLAAAMLGLGAALATGNIFAIAGAVVSVVDVLP